MSDRDRLIELIEQAEGLKNNDFPSVEEIADHILADGWIRMPCKVGDTVYYPYDYGNKVLEKTVKRIVIENGNKWIDVGVSFLPFENIGKTVFLTKEEAEAELRKIGENNA